MSRREWLRCWRGSGVLKVPWRFWSLGLDFGFNKWNSGDVIRAVRYLYWSIDNISLCHASDSHLPYFLRAQTSDRFALQSPRGCRKAQ
jgi:hypothetical protein